MNNAEFTIEGSALLPTEYGEATIYVFTKEHEHKEHTALVFGDIKNKKNVMVRIHSECLTGDVFHSLRCDCRQQLEKAIETIKQTDCGVIVYLRQEGRGIGLNEKIKAYHLQESKNLNTYEANTALGHKEDAREYTVAANILKALNIQSVNLLSNNPLKKISLEKAGIIVSQTTPLLVKTNKYNQQYVETKLKKAQNT